MELWHAKEAFDQPAYPGEASTASLSDSPSHTAAKQATAITNAARLRSRS